jgi:chromosome segregation ATPase
MSSVEWAERWRIAALENQELRQTIVALRATVERLRADHDCGHLATLAAREWELRQLKDTVQRLREAWDVSRAELQEASRAALDRAESEIVHLRETVAVLRRDLERAVARGQA